MLCDTSDVPSATETCQISECQRITDPDGASICVAEGKRVDYHHCERLAPKLSSEAFAQIVVYLLFEGSKDDVSGLLEGKRRRPMSHEFENAITHWVVSSTVNISTQDIAMTAVKGPVLVPTQFLVELSITAPATLTETLLLDQLKPKVHLFEAEKFVLRGASASRLCFSGYTGCGSCRSDGQSCPLTNALSSSSNIASVYWNGTTKYNSLYSQFYRPQSVIDGFVGQDSLATFRTSESSGILRFDLGRIVRATSLRINWFQRPAQHWELWVQEEPGYIIVSSRRSSSKLKLVTSMRCEPFSCNEVQDVPLHNEGLDREPLFLRMFELRLKKPAVSGAGFAIDEVHLFGDWDEITTVGEVGAQISSVGWVLLGIAGVICLSYISSKAIPWLRGKFSTDKMPKLPCAMYDSRWYQFRCRNCHENWFQHLLQNPRSVMPETAM